METSTYYSDEEEYIVGLEEERDNLNFDDKDKDIDDIETKLQKSSLTEQVTNYYKEEKKQESFSILEKLDKINENILKIDQTLNNFVNDNLTFSHNYLTKIMTKIDNMQASINHHRDEEEFHNLINTKRRKTTTSMTMIDNDGNNYYDNNNFDEEEGGIKVLTLANNRDIHLLLNGNTKNYGRVVGKNGQTLFELEDVFKVKIVVPKVSELRCIPFIMIIEKKNCKPDVKGVVEAISLLLQNHHDYYHETY